MDSKYNNLKKEVNVYLNETLDVLDSMVDRFDDEKVLLYVTLLTDKMRKLGGKFE